MENSNRSQFVVDKPVELGFNEAELDSAFKYVLHPQGGYPLAMPDLLRLGVETKLEGASGSYMGTVYHQAEDSDPENLLLFLENGRLKLYLREANNSELQIIDESSDKFINEPLIDLQKKNYALSRAHWIEYDSLKDSSFKIIFQSTNKSSSVPPKPKSFMGTLGRSMKRQKKKQNIGKKSSMFEATVKEESGIKAISSFADTSGNSLLRKNLKLLTKLGSVGQRSDEVSAGTVQSQSTLGKIATTLFRKKKKKIKSATREEQLRVSLE